MFLYEFNTIEEFQIYYAIEVYALAECPVSFLTYGPCECTDLADDIKEQLIKLDII